MTTSALVPGSLPVAIDGHPYLCDPDYERTTVQVIREQSDGSDEPGEQSLTPLGLWRRSQESWHHGAGQDFLDGRLGDQPPDSHRFRSSKGVDIWTRGQASLLHPTLKAWSTSSSNLFLAVAQATTGVFFLYVADGNQLYWAGIPYNLSNSLALQNGTGWTASNATIGATMTWFTLTATAAAIPTAISPAGTSGFPVDAGREYGFAFQSVSGVGTAKTPTVAVRWYDSGGSTISTTTPVVAGGTDGAGGVTVFGTATAPSTAVYAALVLSYTSAWSISDTHDVQAATIGPYENVSTLGAPDTWASADIQGGEAAQAIQSITSNGSYVWAALGTSGLHRTTAAGTSSTINVPAAPASGQVSLVGYANGFLLAAGSAGTSSSRRNSLWLVSDPLGTPALSLIKTHDNTNFTWEGIGPGRSCVYAYGNSGGTGEIYKILFDPNTGSLSTAASFATYLPDGETIHALQFYAGSVILGTGRGVRIGTADGAGNIDYGPLISTDWPVRCLEPQDRYCWFGWTKYDTTNSGLGRVDLGFLTDTLTPAWASDLMTADTSTGDTVAAVTFAPYGYTANQRPPIRVFTVAAEGVYIEDPGSREPTGQLETGTIRFSTSEPKTARSLDVRHHALPAGGIVAAELQVDSSGTWTSVGSSSTTDSYGPAAPLDLGDQSAEAFEFRFTLDRPDNAGTDFTNSPEMTRWTAKVLPTPSTIDETFTLNLQMRSTVTTTAADGLDYHLDVPGEVTFLKDLEQSREIVEFQIADDTFEGYVVASQWKGDHWNSPLREFSEGVLTVQLQTARG